MDELIKKELIDYKVKTSSAQEERVQRLHRDTMIFDQLATHVIDDAYIKVLKATGVNAVHYTVASTSFRFGENCEDHFVDACRNIGYWNRLMDKYSNDVEVALSISHMHEIWKRGKIAIFYGFQNGSPIEDNLDYIKLFHDMGIRYIMITYNIQNFIGCGGGESKDCGLSDFGRKVIKEMNRQGIVVDLSHCGHKTSFEAIDVSDKPCILTHANPISLAPVNRNKSDELVRFLVSKGGVVGPKHMIGNMCDKPAEETTVEDYVDMIEHYVKLVGIDSVCIGTDFCGTVYGLRAAIEHIDAIRAQSPEAYIGKRQSPYGFANISNLYNVTRCLVKRGYSDDDIAKLYSENACRVLKVIFEE